MKQVAFQLAGINEFQTEQKPGQCLTLKNGRAAHGRWGKRGGSKLYTTITLTSGTQEGAIRGVWQEIAVTATGSTSIPHGSSTVVCALIKKVGVTDRYHAVISEDGAPFTEVVGTVGVVGGVSMPLYCNAPDGNNYLFPIAPHGCVWLNDRNIPKILSPIYSDGVNAVTDWPVLAEGWYVVICDLSLPAHTAVPAGYVSYSTAPAAKVGCYHAGHVVIANGGTSEGRNYIVTSDTNFPSYWMGLRLWQVPIPELSG
ncbi:MAG: hypothetical protein V1929_12695, partial [bacterium]